MLSSKQDTPEVFWHSLRYLAIIRLVIAATLLLILPVYTRRFEVGLAQNVGLLTTVAISYVLVAVVAMVSVRRLPFSFFWQLAIHILVDLIVLSALVLAVGGPRSGFGVMLLVPVAATAILSSATWALFTAAIASVMLLGVSVYLSLAEQPDPGYLAAAATGTMLFGVAFVVNKLAANARAQEVRAERRGEDLRTQLMVNQTVIAELTDGVVIFRRDGKVRVMNRAAQTILGLAPNESTIPDSNSTITGFTPYGDGWEVVSQQFTIWQATDPRLPMQCEVLLRAATQSEGIRGKRVRLRFLPTSSRIDSRRDSSDYILVVEDLERIELQAQQLKLASMGRLSASIAHEIRNPLGAIRHANSLLQESIAQFGKPTDLRLGKIVEDNSLRINRIIEDILAIARRESAQVQPIDLNAYFAEFLPAFFEQTGQAASILQLRLLSDRKLDFDPAHLRQILVNLLSNALRYCSGRPGAVQWVWAINENGQAGLLLLDDGPGVAKELLPSLFEPFATTESKGTGLGLYLARELCQANRCSLHYETEPARWLAAGKPNVPLVGVGFVIIPTVE